MDWVINSNRNLFPTVLDAGKSKIKFPAGLVSGEGCSLLPRWCLVPCVFTWWKEEGKKDTTSPKGPAFSNYAIGIKFQHEL
jgi:hypothetical protein